MSIFQLVPMWRLTERMVRSGLVMAWRLATSPTRTSPFLAKATTDGVVRDPSALGMTTGSPASRTLTTELVVPRSIPTALGMGGHSPCGSPGLIPTAFRAADFPDVLRPGSPGDSDRLGVSNPTATVGVSQECSKVECLVVRFHAHSSDALGGSTDPQADHSRCERALA